MGRLAAQVVRPQQRDAAERGAGMDRLLGYAGDWELKALSCPYQHKPEACRVESQKPDKANHETREVPLILIKINCRLRPPE